MRGSETARASPGSISPKWVFASVKASVSESATDALSGRRTTVMDGPWPEEAFGRGRATRTAAPTVESTTMTASATTNDRRALMATTLGRCVARRSGAEIGENFPWNSPLHQYGENPVFPCCFGLRTSRKSTKMSLM